MFSAMKDAVTSKAAQTFVNQRIARYGEVQSLKIDSKQKSVEIVCQLLGEPAPITVRVENYELRDGSDGEKRLRIGACSASRPWLENLLADQVRGREFPVPGWAASAL
jgi:hypothetical protein